MTIHIVTKGRQRHPELPQMWFRAVCACGRWEVLLPFVERVDEAAWQHVNDVNYIVRITKERKYPGGSYDPTEDLP